MTAGMCGMCGEAPYAPDFINLCEACGARIDADHNREGGRPCTRCGASDGVHPIESKKAPEGSTMCDFCGAVERPAIEPWLEIAPETWIWTNRKGLPEIAKVTQTWGDRWDLVPATALPCPVVHRAAVPGAWELRIPNKWRTKHLFASAESARSAVDRIYGEPIGVSSDD